MSIYRDYNQEQIEELLSNFLISSWSYSKVTQFARHEKAFEMQYIYGERSKSSATTTAGSAYHYALDMFFSEFKSSGKLMDLPTLEGHAFEFIEDVAAVDWKLQTTTPTVDDCKQKALKTVNALLKNFVSEISTYIEDIEEVLEVEAYCNEFLTVNGVDIPMPCHAKIDLRVRLKNGKIVIIDHKSKSVFSKEEVIKLSIGVQAITYVLCAEAKYHQQVDEVWFIENKYSQNKDKSAQLNAFKVAIDENSRRLYETILYEPLKRLISAVNDPDYNYLINDSDNFVDMAEIYEFWAKTMMSEIEEFNVDPSKKQLIDKRLKKTRDASIATISPTVIKNFRKNAAEFIQYDLSNKDMTTEEKIEHVLRSFSIVTKTAHKFIGYSSNTFLLEVSAGVKISTIQNHKLDIANVLNVSNVRVPKDLVVYEDKSYLAIEFAKKREATLHYNSKDLVGLKLPIGKDNFGNTVVWDLENHSTPHMLVCGATGSGKSVMIMSTIEYALEAGITDIRIFDPKYEFMDYKTKGVKVFNDIDDIEEEMRDLVDEMNFRVMNNSHSKTLVVFDEFADAVASSKKGKALGGLKSLEENLKILLQKGRSSGFRVVAATQRASVKVITGDAKVNFPVQVCFRVPKEIDSKVVIDEAGAESLTGMGDGLVKSPEYIDTVRFQAYKI